MYSKIVLWIIVISASAGLLISANFFRDKGPAEVSKGTPTPSETTLSSLNPSPSPRPSPAPKPLAAACQIKGEIVFLNRNLYENKGATIAYQNVDDVIRQIFWKSEPADGALTVGPNLFEDLPLPDGERNIGLVLTKESPAKNYTLTASITYGVRNSSGIIEEKIANCTGKVSVDLQNI